MYKVIKYFTDLQDHEHPYHVGDEFPRSGMVVSEARLEELASASNKQGVPLIELVAEAGSAAEPAAEVDEVVKTEETEEAEPIMNEPVPDESDAAAEPVPEKKRGRKSK